jgi:hypothetical protein
LSIGLFWKQSNSLGTSCSFPSPGSRIRTLTGSDRAAAQHAPWRLCGIGTQDASSLQSPPRRTGHPAYGAGQSRRSSPYPQHRHFILPAQQPLPSLAAEFEAKFGGKVCLQTAVELWKTPLRRQSVTSAS